MEKFAIATFCYGERYQKQVNRMISEIDTCDFKPTLVVVTDNIDNILDKPFVKKYDISQFNPEYKLYSDNYYTFDFSVKRYSLLAALNLGFTKVILCDADAVPNKSIFNEEHILQGFVENSIQGQVTYNFSNEIITNSQLGRRFLSYENYFKVSYDKNQLNFMPEDCIQFINIDIPKFYNFLRIWDECIKHKNLTGLSNTPAGNIDEMCFAALNCDITVGNNSDRCMNVLTPIHDKWYDSSFSNIEENKKRKKIIVTSIYELFYCEERGSGLYKGIDLLTITIRNLIFDGFDYVIYTDKNTYNKYNLSNLIPQKNVTFKFVELNGDYYSQYLKPIQLRRINEGEIWDRIHCVNNYIEVILNKIEFMLEESKLDSNSDLVWIDSGLFGTSCSNGWRDYMNEICHTKNFLDKIFEKINEYEFFSLKGNHILINYEIKNKINFEFNTNTEIIPACLFGGHSNLIVNYFANYKNIVSRLVNLLNDYTSEQEILFLLLNDKKIKFFEFDDWDDLQKGMLKIIDLYDEENYNKNISINRIEKQKTSIDLFDKYKSFTDVADFFGIDKGSLHESHMYTKTYEEIMSKSINENPVIVEIGINDPRFPGGCLLFWDNIFPNMEYYGFDIVDCNHLPHNQNKIKLFKGDQNNPNDLQFFISSNDISKKINYIIDDGSHEHEHIVTTFINLYPHLKSGGVYFIEDLHASWAKRDETLMKIKDFLKTNEYTNIDESNYKLLIITK